VTDCVENKDTLQTILAAGKSRKEGEFYTPEIWCVDGREYLKADGVYQTAFFPGPGGRDHDGSKSGNRVRGKVTYLS
jgi:hypothetical protein